MFVMLVVIRKIADRIQWQALRSACVDMGAPYNTLLHDVTDFSGDGYNSSADSVAREVSIEHLRLLHHLLFELHIMEGELVCPQSSRRFFVREGIPNMLLHEDEVADGAGGESLDR